MSNLSRSAARQRMWRDDTPIGVDMSSRWDVVADDPTLSRRGLIERLDATDNPRHRTMLETLIEHDRCEGACDIDGVMATFGSGPAFIRWGATGDTGPKGSAAIRAHYEAMFARGGTRNLRLQYGRVVVDDDSIVAEYRVTRIVPWAMAKQAGFLIPEDRGRYAVSVNLLGMFPFDDDGLMLGEISYGSPMNPNDFERVPDDELTEGYLEWERRYA